MYPTVAPAKEIGARVLFLFTEIQWSVGIYLRRPTPSHVETFPSSRPLHKSSVGALRDPAPCIARVSDHSAKEGNYEWITREREKERKSERDEGRRKGKRATKKDRKREREGGRGRGGD